ncbi:MAG: DnaB helicase C-terminal domain-containing protein [Bacilli bacterium]|nr:DnaB helicase C-terminal domain-containing protein [Bacilli bacterium]
MEIIKLEKGRLSVLLGKSGLGKSTISVYNAAGELREGKGVLYFSYEYCQSIIYNKLHSHFGVKWTELFKINVVDCAGVALDELCHIVKMRANQVDSVYIDYLDLLRSATYGEAKNVEDITGIVATLAKLAKECNVAIILLAQADANCEVQDMVNGLNNLVSTCEDPNKVIKMFIGRDKLFHSIIHCEDISHVIWVDGSNLEHFSSINIKETYKD